MYRTLFLLLLFLFFPTLTFASGLSKQDACSYPDGIHDESVYIYWPGKIVHVGEFLKKDGFLYYFIHTFSSKDALVSYRDHGDMRTRNSGSYLASYDCTRSRVKFYPNVRTLGGTAYGKFRWVQ